MLSEFQYLRMRRSVPPSSGGPIGFQGTASKRSGLVDMQSASSEDRRVVPARTGQGAAPLVCAFSEVRTWEFRSEPETGKDRGAAEDRQRSPCVRLPPRMAGHLVNFGIITKRVNRERENCQLFRIPNLLSTHPSRSGKRIFAPPVERSGSRRSL